LVHEYQILLFTEANRTLKFESDYTYKSFINNLSDDLEKFNVYKNLFNCIDYLNQGYKQINDFHDKYCDTISIKTIKFKELIDDLSSLIAINLKRVGKNSNMYSFLGDMLKRFIALTKSTTNIYDYEKEMLYDLREVIVKQYSDSPDMEILLVKAKQVANLINDIDFESEIAVESFNKYIFKYSEVITKLDEQIKEIKLNSTQHSV